MKKNETNSTKKNADMTTNVANDIVKRANYGRKIPLF